MSIKIEYNGSYPNLCSGSLVVVIDEKRYEFPSFCLDSGGSVWFGDEGEEHVEEGEWAISDWPSDFPEDLKEEVLRAINEKIEWGCCGGCI